MSLSDTLHDDPPPPIVIPCEGSGTAVHARAEFLAAGHSHLGMCPMCGRAVRTTRAGLAYAHDRHDIVAMIERGDFG